MYRSSVDPFVKKGVKFVKVPDCAICFVDQYPVQPFNKNEFGWPRNSISAMAHAQSYQEFLSIAGSLTKNPAQYNLKEGTTFKDAIIGCRPRFCQSPDELMNFAEHLAKHDMDKLDAAYQKALDSQIKNVVDGSVDKSNIDSHE